MSTTNPNPQKLSPQEAADKLTQGATLIDIRGFDEFARTHIVGAVCVPADNPTFTQDVIANVGNADNKTLIFHCLSGVRTAQNAHKITACMSNCTAYVLDGGLQAWQKAGLPVQKDTSQPISLMRQVQLIAGALVVLGVGLGASVSPWFLALSAFVGAGLMFAGATGFCGMAKLLALLPYNRTLNQ